MRLRWWMFGLAAGLAVVPASAAGAGGDEHAGGGGGGGGGGHCQGFAAGNEVALRDSCIAGTAHFAEPGEVVVVNEGEAPHNLTAVDGGFETGALGPGASGSVAVAEPGIYRVYCTLHGTTAGEGMAGVLIIGDAVPDGQALARTDLASATGGLEPASGGGVSGGVAAGLAAAAVASVGGLWWWARRQRGV